MHEVLTALAGQQQELTDLLTGCRPEDWARPSACDGWDVADVVLHLVQTNDLAIASALGTFGSMRSVRSPGAEGQTPTIDDLAALAVQDGQGMTPEELFTRWTTGADALVEVLEDCRPSQRVQWVAGELSARTLATTRLAETWIHTGDVAEGLGIPTGPTDRLWHVARLAWRTVPYAVERDGGELHGDVGFDLTAPDGGQWSFGLDVSPATVIRGSGYDLCRVASRRVDATQTDLVGTGPDAEQVLRLVRTWA